MTPPLTALRRLPPLIRFMLAHGVVGFGLSALAMLALFWSDLGGIATLMQKSDLAPVPALLLWFFMGLTFGSVQIGTAVMLLPYPDDENGRDGGHRARPPLLAALAVPVRVTPRRG
ncbi:hypothetical protein [Oleisolibacter albus]|uniref:hypothetical protein n=1 Tax=Oleisolibacter albus TaxID=2171757 RepID=UPI000DF27732|nr:hypothetical protein [Oleisolibacter albus]